MATDTTEALAEYLLENSENIQQPGRFTSQQKGAILHGSGDPVAAVIEADRELDNKALRKAIVKANKTPRVPSEPPGGILNIIKKGRKGALRQKNIKSSVANAINLRNLK